MAIGELVPSIPLTVAVAPAPTTVAHEVFDDAHGVVALGVPDPVREVV